MAQIMVCEKCNAESSAVDVYENNRCLGLKCDHCGVVSRNYHRYRYKMDCSCGRTLRVLTQGDEYPEYRLDVSVECVCGLWVVFSLPCN